VSAGRARRPAQGATEAAGQGSAGRGDSRKASGTATDEGHISTLVLFVESGTRDAASAASYLLRRASSNASPRGLPISGADYDTRAASHVSPDQSAPGPFNVAVAGIVGTEDRQPQVGVGCPQVRSALPLVTPHPFTGKGPRLFHQPRLQQWRHHRQHRQIGRCGHRGPIVTCQFGQRFLLLSVKVAEKLRG